MTGPYRLGVDVGGTHTDLVLLVVTQLPLLVTILAVVVEQWLHLTQVLVEQGV